MSESADPRAPEPPEPTLSAEIDRRYLVKFVNALRTADDECRLRFGPGGLSVHLVDPANISMVEAELPAAVFNQYDGPDEEQVIDLNLTRLSDLLEGAFSHGRDYGVTVLDGDLVLWHGRDSHTISGIDPESVRKEPDLPIDLDELTAEATVRGTRFKSAIDSADQALSQTDDEVELIAEADADRGTIALLAEGEYGDSRYVFGEDDAGPVTVDADGEARYSIDYLRDWSGAIMASPPVTVGFADEWPLVVSYPIRGGWKHDGQGLVRFMLAPRITDRGDD